VKEGHVFHASPDGLHFSHQKLSSLRVWVHDLSGVPVSGVLLSLSSDAFNENRVTREDGSFVFGQLFPGDYFLRLQLKEYEFEPATRTVKVGEGVSLDVEVIAERVAFSVFGSVRTITGQPVSKQRVLVRVEGRKESAVSDLRGEFRVRGIRPGEKAEISVSGSSVLPVKRFVTMGKKDEMDADFTVMQTPSSMVGMCDETYG
jgi:hypothetical protein